MLRSFFYVVAMTRSLCLLVGALFSAFACVSCVTAEKKPEGPKTETSNIPWNSPQAGQGQGQFGMLPQNQYRR